MSTLTVIFLFCVIILLMITIYLSYWNWGEKVISHLLSISLGIGAFGLVSIFTLLKSELNEKRAFCYVVVDKINYKPIDLFSISVKTSDLSNPAQSLHEFGKNFNNSISKLQIDILRVFNSKSDPLESTKKEDVMDYYCELLQYKIIQEIRNIQLEHSYSREILDELGVKHLSKGFHQPQNNIDTSPYLEITELIKENRFHDGYLEDWANIKMSLPKNIVMRIGKENIDGINSRYILFHLKKYFDYKIEIIPSQITEDGTLPEGLTVPLMYASNFKSIVYSIRMKSSFHKLTSLNDKTEGYKSWVKWMQNEVEKVIAN